MIDHNLNFGLPADKAEKILEVRDLTTYFETDKKRWMPVDGLSFDLCKGKTLALVGESGCGKTVAALSLMRLLPQPPALFSTGEIWYQQKNLLALSEKEMRRIRGGKISIIFQDPMSALNPVYSIGAQLVEAAVLHLMLDEEEAHLLAAATLDAVGIQDAAKRFHDYPHQLSGGMKQRVLIGMSLICQPDILIADEPTTALDTTLQAQILKLMKNYQKSRAMAMLLITHDMGVVSEIADEALIMYLGQSIERGSVGKIFAYPGHPYTRGLFESIPSIFEKKQLKPIVGQVPSFSEIPQGCRFHPRCPYVMEKCKKGAVPDFPVCGDRSHTAACWLHDGSQESERSHFGRGGTTE